MTVLDDRFPRWFESVELEPASERYAALCEAAEAVGRSLDLAAALNLVTYAVGRDSAPAFEAVHAAVSAHDRTFAAAAGDLEPRLVAAAALARVLENNDRAVAVVAGAVLSAEFAGLRSPVEELPQLARAALTNRYRGLRGRVAVPAEQLENIFNELPRVTADRPAHSGEEVGRLRAATGAVAERLIGTLATFGQRVDTRLDAADEELDILWWAFAAPSTDNAIRWTGRSGPDVLVRAGLELANRHRFESEVPSAQEILRRVLGPLASEEYSLLEVVVGSADQVALDSAQPGPLFPILTSCAECLAAAADPAPDAFPGDRSWVASRGDNSWVDSAGRYGVDPTIRRRGDEIAAQTMRELLLARALS